MKEAANVSRRHWLRIAGGLGIVGSSGCLRMIGDQEQSNNRTTDNSQENFDTTDNSQEGGTSPEGEDDSDSHSGQQQVTLEPAWEQANGEGGRVISAGGDFLIDWRNIFRQEPDGTLLFELPETPDAWYAGLDYGWENPVHLDETGLYLGAHIDDDYEGEHGARLYTYDSDTGKQRWYFEEPADGKHNRITSIVRVDDTVIYASQATGSGDEQEPIIRAVDYETGEERWKFSLSGDFVNQIIAFENRLYVQQLWVLRSYDLATRDMLEKKRVGGGFSPAVRDGTELFVPASTVRKLDAKSFEEEWATTTEYEINTSPGVGEEGVYFGTESGYIVGVSREGGNKLWESRVEGAVSHPPVVEDDIVWIADERGGLSAFSSSSGERVFNEDLEPDFRFAIQDSILKDSVRKSAFEIQY